MRNSDPANKRALLEELLDERILVLDGAMGSMIYGAEPSEEDYRGDASEPPGFMKNCTEVLVLTQPRLIEQIHLSLSRSRSGYHRDRLV